MNRSNTNTNQEPSDFTDNGWTYVFEQNESFLVARDEAFNTFINSLSGDQTPTPPQNPPSGSPINGINTVFNFLIAGSITAAILLAGGSVHTNSKGLVGKPIAINTTTVATNTDLDIDSQNSDIPGDDDNQTNEENSDSTDSNNLDPNAGTSSSSQTSISQSDKPNNTSSSSQNSSTSTTQSSSTPPQVALNPIYPAVANAEWGLLENYDGTFLVNFTYSNKNKSNITIPVGQNNYFSPGAKDRGQPTLFKPNTGETLNVTLNCGETVTWTIVVKGQKQSQTVSTPACDRPTQGLIAPISGEYTLRKISHDNLGGGQLFQIKNGSQTALTGPQSGNKTLTNYNKISEDISLGNFNAGDEIVLMIYSNLTKFNSYSYYPEHAKISKIANNCYQVAFEDQFSIDFKDLVLEICPKPTSSSSTSSSTSIPNTSSTTSSTTSITSSSSVSISSQSTISSSSSTTSSITQASSSISSVQSSSTPATSSSSSVTSSITSSVSSYQAPSSTAASSSSSSQTTPTPPATPNIQLYGPEGYCDDNYFLPAGSDKTCQLVIDYPDTTPDVSVVIRDCALGSYNHDGNLQSNLSKYYWACLTFDSSLRIAKIEGDKIYIIEETIASEISLGYTNGTYGMQRIRIHMYDIATNTHKKSAVFRRHAWWNGINGCDIDDPSTYSDYCLRDNNQFFSISLVDNITMNNRYLDILNNYENGPVVENFVTLTEPPV